jgi:hypothetical protein
MFIENPELFRDLGTNVPIIKKAKGGVVKPKAKTEELQKLKDQLIKAGTLSDRYSFAEQEMIKKNLEDVPASSLEDRIKALDKVMNRVKKAKGGSVLKEATDDRNRTPKRSICRGGGAAMKGVKFTGVK